MSDAAGAISLDEPSAEGDDGATALAAGSSGGWGARSEEAALMGGRPACGRVRGEWHVRVTVSAHAVLRRRAGQGQREHHALGML